MKKMSILAFIAGTLLITACGNSGSEFVGYWGNTHEEIGLEITHYKDNQYFVSSGEKVETAIYKGGILEMDGQKVALDKKTGKINYKGLEFIKSSPEKFTAAIKDNERSRLVGPWGSVSGGMAFEITHNKDNQYLISSDYYGKEIALYKDGILEMEVDGTKIALDKKTGQMMVVQGNRYYNGGVKTFTKISPKEMAAIEDERSRNSAVQSMLQQIALAQVALDTAPEENRGYVSTDGSTGKLAVTELFDLGRFGFRPDPEVAFAITVAPDGYFIAIAGHVDKGSIVYIYDNINSVGVIPYDANYRPPANVKLPATLHTYAYDDTTGKFSQGPARTYTRPGAGPDGAAKME